MKRIDYSQYSLYLFCAWAWYERYVKGMDRRYTGQRDDALALGTLFHNAMDNWKKIGKAMIGADAVEEVNPTPECMSLAEMLVRGYVMKYPQEVWKEEVAEGLVEFPLTGKYVGAAKLDRYFYVESDTTIDSGIPDQPITLGKGWWSREFKTKSPGIPRGSWMKEWAAKRQADFQLLALQHVLSTRGYDRGDVRGVLVSVAEKPREYTPHRKCKGCGESYPLETFRVSAEGHRCPMCGHPQHLKPYEPKVPPKPDYFRMVVTRTPEQLDMAEEEIWEVAVRMNAYEQGEMEWDVPNRDNCISNKYHRECVYAEDHIGGTEVKEPKYVKIDPYGYMGVGV